MDEKDPVSRENGERDLVGGAQGEDKPGATSVPLSEKLHAELPSGSSADCYPLHWLVWHNDHRKLEAELSKGKVSRWKLRVILHITIILCRY